MSTKPRSLRPHTWQGSWGLLATVFVLALTLALNQDHRGGEAASPGPCDAPIVNPIVCENSKPGNPPSEWDISGAGDPSIQGFATEISVNQGETRSLQDRHRRRRLSARHLPYGLLRRHGRTQSSDRSALGVITAESTSLLHRSVDGAHRLR